MTCDARPVFAKRVYRATNAQEVSTRFLPFFLAFFPWPSAMTETARSRIKYQSYRIPLNISTFRRHPHWGVADAEVKIPSAE